MERDQEQVGWCVILIFASHVEVTWRTYSYASQNHHPLQRSTRVCVTPTRAFAVKYLQSTVKHPILFSSILCFFIFFLNSTKNIFIKKQWNKGEMGFFSRTQGKPFFLLHCLISHYKHTRALSKPERIRASRGFLELKQCPF